MMRFDFDFFQPGCIILPAIKFSIQGSHTIAIYPAGVTVISPCLYNMAGVCAESSAALHPSSVCATVYLLLMNVKTGKGARLFNTKLD